LKELIFGLDPGSRITGFGVIAVGDSSDDIQHIAHGVIQLNERAALGERLCMLHSELNRLFKKFPVSTVVIEKIFFAKNADSAFKLGHARGVALMTAVEHGAQIAEYAARQVKKVVTGHGGADKASLQILVQRLLRFRLEESAFDASDALSLAVCHVRVRESSGRIQKMLEGEV
jgi:crossover junction endodeoxyribonuclease RuvC